MNRFHNIDWDLLRKQKSKIMERTGDSDLDEAHDGIIGLIDAIQDFAVDVLGYSERVVFGEDFDDSDRQ